MTLAQLKRAYPALNYQAPMFECTNALATFGGAYDESTDARAPNTAVFHHGRIVGLDAGDTNAVSTRGLGEFTTLSAIRSEYPHRVTISKIDGDEVAHVKLAHTSLKAVLTTQFGSTYVASPPDLYSGHSSNAPQC
jgi:hypothetical protein